MPEIWTILKLLNWTQDYFQKKQIPNPRLDAEVLLAHALGLKRIELYMQFDRPLKEEELASYKALIKRRAQFEPIAYITGTKEFWSRSFYVNPQVLIPRPETEIIVENAIQEKTSFQNILDIGTGSGILAITLAKEFPQAKVTAIDVSPQALDVARQNAKAHDTEHIQFELADIKTFAPQNKFDLIVSNPPYIESEKIKTLMPDVQKFEPVLALDGGADGLDFYRVIIQLAQTHLTPQGTLILEIGETQGEALLNLLESWNYKVILKDSADLNRIIKAKPIS